MRCCCCDVILTPQESVRKFRDSGHFTDTCTRCLRDIPVATTEGFNYDDDHVDVAENLGAFDNDDLDEI